MSTKQHSQGTNMQEHHNTTNNHVNPPARQFIYNIPESVLFDNSLVLTDVRIYMIVRSFMDTTGQAFFSNDWAAKKLNVDPRTVRRSIARLVEREHLHREDDNNLRYLTIKLKVKTDPELVAEGRTSVSGGGGSKCPGGEDPNVLQLDQRSILSKTTAQPQKSWIEERQKLLEVWEQIKAADIKLSFNQLEKLVKKHGYTNQYILSKLELMKPRDDIKNRSAFFTSSLQDDYEHDNEANSQPKAAKEDFSAERVISHNQNTRAHSEALAALKAQGINEPLPQWMNGGSMSGDNSKYMRELVAYEKLLSEKILELGGTLPS